MKENADQKNSEYGHFFTQWSLELYAETKPVFTQTTKMKRLTKIVNRFQPLAISAKVSILDTCRDSGCTSDTPILFDILGKGT